MKITKIETLHVSIPFETGGQKQGMRPGLAAWDRMAALIVRVETDDGRVGWGECFGHFVIPGTEAILKSLVGPWFLGKDASQITALMEDSSRAFHGFGRNGPVLYALSGIDIALWDLAAQRAGLPLYQMLGGGSGEVRLYASLMRTGASREVLSTSCRKAQKAGFPLIKLHENTIPAFMAARDSVGPEVDITLDVNCPWSVMEAKSVARAIRDKGFHWLEEPVWPPEDFAGLAEVRKEGVSIAAGENIGNLHDFRKAFEAGALDVAQPSVVKVGGISAMRQIFTLAQAFSVRVVPHCFYWGPGYLATAHLAASMPRPALVETAFVSFEKQPHPLFDPSKGTLKLNATPGLGFAPDMKVMEAYMVSRHTIGT